MNNYYVTLGNKKYIALAIDNDTKKGYSLCSYCEKD